MKIEILTALKTWKKEEKRRIIADMYVCLWYTYFSFVDIRTLLKKFSHWGWALALGGRVGLGIDQKELE